jgi:hypothetical protein
MFCVGLKVRKNFNIEERIAIGEAIEAELGNRQGQRTDLKSGLYVVLYVKG